MVPQYTKDHLCSIISLPPDWLGYDTTQMILGILGHHGASRFPVSVPGFHWEDSRKKRELPVLIWDFSRSLFFQLPARNSRSRSGSN